MEGTLISQAKINEVHAFRIDLTSLLLLRKNSTLLEKRLFLNQGHHARNLWYNVKAKGRIKKC